MTYLVERSQTQFANLPVAPREALSLIDRAAGMSDGLVAPTWWSLHRPCTLFIINLAKCKWPRQGMNPEHGDFGWKPTGPDCWLGHSLNVPCHWFHELRRQTDLFECECKNTAGNICQKRVTIAAACKHITYWSQTGCRRIALKYATWALVVSGSNGTLSPKRRLPIAHALQ
jgi:hypothetical protein